MYTTSTLHPSLIALLEFEELRLSIPIEVSKKSRRDHASQSPPRPVIEVRIHSGTRPETFPVMLSDELLELTAPAHVVQCDREVGFTDATGQFCSLAGVTGNIINIYFDLNQLFANPENVRRKPTNGTAPTGHAGNKLADLVFSQALPIALRNIRRFDWKRETRQYVTAKLGAVEGEARQWQLAIRSNDRALTERSHEVQSLSAKNAELREMLRLHQLVTSKRRERQAEGEHGDFLRLIGRSLRKVEFMEGNLRCLSGSINIEYGGVTYELGCYWIVLPLGQGRLTITPEDRSHDVEGYPHPHIASDGTPCLGNIGASVAQLRGEGKHFECVTMLLEFLRSYNPDNPYLRIERWDPDWQDDDDRFDSCYDDASLSDCATCNDDECHHLDGARRRCYEHTDTNDCIECAGCNRRRDAIDHCRERHESHECVTCETECTFAGDVEACFETHAGENCATCLNEDCDHHKENQNETNR